MKKFFKKLTGILFCLCLAGMSAFPALAEAKASAAESAILTYQPDKISWEGETVTVTGRFVNQSSDKDITQINSAIFHVFDANDKKITETTLNASSLGEVKLAPGEQWNYTVVRTVSGFNPDNFSLASGFKIGCSTDITIGSHGKNCSFCGSRGTLSFATEDTMSQEEWDSMVSRLKQAFADDGTASGGTASGSGNDYYVPYVPTYDSFSTQPITCTACSGAGTIPCDSCDGMGYKMVRERRTCLVLHHPGCSKACGGACHEEDYYMSKKKCLICDGDGRTTCFICGARGHLN